jgi:hypothetical protein
MADGAIGVALSLVVSAGVGAVGDALGVAESGDDADGGGVAGDELVVGVALRTCDSPLGTSLGGVGGIARAGDIGAGVAVPDVGAT